MLSNQLLSRSTKITQDTFDYINDQFRFLEEELQIRDIRNAAVFESMQSEVIALRTSLHEQDSLHQDKIEALHRNVLLALIIFAMLICILVCLIVSFWSEPEPDY